MSKPKNQSSIKILCAHDALVDTDSLIPNPRNPNKHPPQQIDLLAKIIKNQGFRRVIVVSNRSGFVIVGHARLEAAKLLKMPQVPVDYQDYGNEALEWADMIADNRLSELADLSMPDLKDLLQEIDTGAVDMDLTGYDAEALERLMTQVFTDFDPETLDNYEGKVAIVFERYYYFDHEEQIKAALGELEFTVKGAT